MKWHVALIGYVFSYSAAFAQGEIGEYTPPAGLPDAEGSVGEIVAQATDAILPLAVSLAVVMIIVGGIQYALAAGDEEGQARAKRTIKWTMFGLVLALMAYSIVFLVTEVFG